MAILHAGSSHSEFIFNGALNSQTSTAGLPALPASFSECIVMDGALGIPAYVEMNFAPIAEVWVAFDLYIAARRTFFPFLEFYNTTYSTTQPLFTIKFPTNDLAAHFYYWNGTTMVDAGTLPNDFFDANTRRYDTRLKMANTGGVFEVMKDIRDLSTASITDTIHTTATTIDRIRVQGCGVGSGQRHYYFNIFAADEDTKQFELASVTPSANGALQGWAGTFSNINEAGVNDATTISAAAADTLSTFIFPAMPTRLTNFKVAALILGGRGSGGAATPTTFEGVARVGGTDYTTTTEANVPITLATGPFMFKWTLNPATGLPWTVAEINSSQWGFKSKT